MERRDGERVNPSGPDVTGSGAGILKRGGTADSGPLTRVLLIEDDPATARLLSRVLNQAAGVPFVVHWVDQLSEGLKGLAGGSFDVVLLDLMLPDSRGLASLTRVRAQSPLTPVVVVSAIEEESLAIEAVHKAPRIICSRGRSTSIGSCGRSGTPWNETGPSGVWPRSTP